MDATTVVAHESVSLDTLGRRIVGRRFRSLAEKQQIVAETLQPGASVAEVARRHGANANLVFVWRRLHEQGLLATQRQRRAHKAVASMLAVTVSDPAPQPAASSGSYIEIVLADGVRVRSFGTMDVTALAQVLTLLRR